MKKPQLNAIRLNFNFAFGCLLLPLSLLTSCVTVNVNFPESAVQKATDDYVRDLYRTKEQGKPGAPKVTTSPAGSTTFNFDLLNLLPNAEAADPTFELSSPKIAAITEKMKALIPDIKDQKKAGVLGETSDGHLVIHDGTKLKPLLKKRVEDLVREENQNRDRLYSEVLEANASAKGNLPAVKKSFSRSYQSVSDPGTWVQAEDGTWAQKP